MRRGRRRKGEEAAARSNASRPREPAGSGGDSRPRREVGPRAASGRLGRLGSAVPGSARRLSATAAPVSFSPGGNDEATPATRKYLQVKWEATPDGRPWRGSRGVGQDDSQGAGGSGGADPGAVAAPGTCSCRAGGSGVGSLQGSAARGSELAFGFVVRGFFPRKKHRCVGGKGKKKKKIILVKPDCEAAVVDGVAERFEGAVLTDSTGWGGGLWPGSAGNPERRGREEELQLVVLPASPRGCSNETNWREVNR